MLRAKVWVLLIFICHTAVLSAADTYSEYFRFPGSSNIAGSISLSGGPLSMGNNPSGLSGLDTKAIEFSGMFFADGSIVSGAGLAVPSSFNSCLGISTKLYHFSIGGTSFAAEAANAGYVKNISRNLSLSTVINLLRISGGGDSARASGLDLGARMIFYHHEQLSGEQTCFNLSARNMIRPSAVIYDKTQHAVFEAASSPSIDLGVSRSIENIFFSGHDLLVLAIERIWSHDEDIYEYSMTAEYSFPKYFRFSLSYHDGYIWGAGYTIPGWRLDYSGTAGRHSITASHYFGDKITRASYSDIKKLIKEKEKYIDEGAYKKAFETAVRISNNSGSGLSGNELESLRIISETLADITGKDEMSVILKKRIQRYLTTNDPDPLIRACNYLVSINPLDNGLEKYIIKLGRMHSISDPFTPVPGGMNYAEFKLQKALEYFYSGDYRTAIKESFDVVDLIPGSFRAHQIMGSAYYMLGNSEEAEKNWKKAYEINPEDGNLKIYIEKERNILEKRQE